MWEYFHRYLAAHHFYKVTRRCSPWLTAAFIVLISYGLIGGLCLAPSDFQQGDGFRIIYVHVPAAFLSLFIYMFMAVMAAIYLIWKIKLADLVIMASAPLGASFTVLALITGAIWGKPMWGTWWVWDARLTSELILLFLYLGVMALRNSIEDNNIAARAAAILQLVGAVDVPIIHFSVQWWNTLHQGASLSLLSKPTIAGVMLYPLLAMLAAFFIFYMVLMLARVRSELLWRERQSQWVRTVLEVQNG